MSKLLFEVGIRGLVCRLSALCFVLTLVLMLFFGLRYAEYLPSVVTSQDLILIYGLVVFSAGFGQVFSEYPTGDDALMARLNLTIAARTGLLLLAVIVLMQTRDGGLEVPFVAVLITQYLIGLFAGIYLDACRLNRQDSA